MNTALLTNISIRKFCTVLEEFLTHKRPAREESNRSNDILPVARCDYLACSACSKVMPDRPTWPNKANAGVDTGVVVHRCEGGQSGDPRPESFEKMMFSTLPFMRLFQCSIRCLTLRRYFLSMGRSAPSTE